MDAVTLAAANAAAAKKFEITLPPANGTDDTAAINAVLALTGGKRVRGRPGQSYLITAPLIINSRTVLDMTGCTVTLKAGSNCNMVQSAAYTAARTVADVATTAASTTITSATATFAAGDVGKTVTLYGAGVTALGPTLTTTVASVTNATTAVLAVAPAVALSNAVASIGPRDFDIEIVGGAWVRATGNGTTSSLSTNSMQLRRVDNLKVRRLSFTTSDGKYAISLADVNDAVAEDLHFPSTASDGVHVNGPCARVALRRLRGNTGDDLAAFTSNDTAAGYGTITDTVGPMEDLTIEDCVLTGLSNAGATPHAAVIYGDCSGTYQTTRVKIRNCSDKATTAQRSVQLSSAVSDATISDCAGQVVLTTQPASGGTTTPQTQSGIRVRNHHLDPISGGATAAVLVTSLVLTDLTLDGLTLGTTASALAVQAVAIGPGTTATRAEIRNVTRFIANAGRLIYVYGAGTTCTDVVIAGCRVDGVDYSAGRLFTVDTNATVTKVLVTQTRAANQQYTFGISEPATLDLHLSASLFSSVQTLNVSAANVRVRSSGCDWGSGTISIANTGKVRAIGDLQADVSLLDKNMGDQAYNTNAALACGAGPVICNGTNWKHLYTGATY